MKYSKEEIMQYVREADVKFVRLAFCDVFGTQKNIAILPSELPRAFKYGMSIDSTAIAGFRGDVHSDLFLQPDPSTLAILPWRPETGKVVRMFCNVTHPSGEDFESDTRSILQKAVADAEKMGLSFSFAPKMEFYLFRNDENGNPTKVPYDNAGYMDVAPEDKGENVRREICLMLEKMGIQPESSHHEEGPGQNEIDFRYSDPVSAADNAITFLSLVKTVASRNGLTADFSPKPLKGKPGNGMHIVFSVQSEDGQDMLPYVMAGIIDKIKDITAFLNPCTTSYDRLGDAKAPSYASWSAQNRSQLIRIPAAVGDYKRAQLRSPDPMANPYIVFAMLIYAGLYGIKNKLTLPAPAEIDFNTASAEERSKYEKLPASLNEARAIAMESSFIKEYLPEAFVSFYCTTDNSKK